MFPRIPRHCPTEPLTESALQRGSRVQLIVYSPSDAHSASQVVAGIDAAESRLLTAFVSAAAAGDDRVPFVLLCKSFGLMPVSVQRGVAAPALKHTPSQQSFAPEASALSNPALTRKRSMPRLATSPTPSLHLAKGT